MVSFRFSCKWHFLDNVQVDTLPSLALIRNNMLFFKEKYLVVIMNVRKSTVALDLGRLALNV
jgi:hypothetical protein